MKSDLDEYIKKEYDVHKIATASEKLKLGMKERNAKGWYVLPIIRAGQETMFAKFMPNTFEFAKEIPGLINLGVNFFDPKHGALPHSDYDYDMRGDITGKIKCYAVFLGLKIPDSDQGLNGFKLGEQKRTIRQDDIFAFDGSVIHSSWNNTESYRYSSNLDIEESFWVLNNE